MKTLSKDVYGDMKCNVCGADMISTTGGNYYCPKCGFTVNDLVYRFQSCDIPLPQGFGARYGWICPRCGKVNSPDTRSCDCTYSNTIETGKSTLSDSITGKYNPAITLRNNE